MKYTLHHGNNLEVMREMESESVDICVTSPPYNLDMPYGEHKDNMPYDVYLDLMEETFAEVKRLLKPNGHLFVNVAGSSTQPWIGMDVAQRLRNHYILQNNICWVKSFENVKEGVIRGHDKPVNSNRFLGRSWEFMYHFTKEGISPIDRKASGVLYAPEWREQNMARTGKDWRPTNNTWFIPYEMKGWGRKKINGTHPAAYPKALVDKCIKLAGAEGVLLDPYVGSGTSVVAALDNGLEGIGIDIDRDYLDFAEERIQGECRNIFSIMAE